VRDETLAQPRILLSRIPFVWQSQVSHIPLALAFCSLATACINPHLGIFLLSLVPSGTDWSDLFALAPLLLIFLSPDAPVSGPFWRAGSLFCLMKKGGLTHQVPSMSTLHPCPSAAHPYPLAPRICPCHSVRAPFLEGLGLHRMVRLNFRQTLEDLPIHHSSPCPTAVGTTDIHMVTAEMFPPNGARRVDFSRFIPDPRCFST
jgi:hypothetical protein